MAPTFRLTIAHLAAIGAVLALAAAPAGAATITVSPSAADSITDAAHCTLREAITAANTNAAFEGCTAGSGADTIKLPAGTYTNSLTNCVDRFEDVNRCGDLDITSDVTIKGAGAAKTTIDGGSIDRVIDIYRNGGPPADQDPNVTIDGVTIQHGKAPSGATGHTPNGGAIEVFDAPSTLTLSHDVVTASKAGAGNPGSGGGGDVGGGGGGIFSAGTLNVDDSSIDHNVAGLGGGHNAGGRGGGIYSLGNLRIDASTIADNAGGPASEVEPGGFGGGVYASGGTVAITSSTISGNRGGNGVGNYTGGFGGGILDEGAITIANSTIVDNRAGNGSGGPGGDGGGVAVITGPATLTSDTIAGNGAGTGTADGAGANYVAGSAGTDQVSNTILASGTRGANCDGTFQDMGHNLSFGDPAASCPGTFAIGNPKLGKLADNGGPTKTLAIASSGAAFDRTPATVSSCPTADQRGVGRPQGKRCDIGAFELERKAPGTKITKSSIDATHGRASFEFKATGALSLTASAFQCALVKTKHGKHVKPRLKGCGSPLAYRGLGPGRYEFEVRAENLAGKDATPAEKRFEIG